MRSLASLLLVVVCAVNTLAQPDRDTSRQESILLRGESLLVLPNSQPMLYVRVANVSTEPFAGTVSIQVPESWQVASFTQDVQLSAGEEKRLGFSVAKGDEDKDNSYLIEMTATGKGVTAVRRQTIVVASAPYFKPTIDGDPSDWKDAIPVTFVVDGKKTTIATYWNRRQFSMLVAVEETRHIRRGEATLFRCRAGDARPARKGDWAITRGCGESVRVFDFGRQPWRVRLSPAG